MSKGAELHDFQTINDIRNALIRYQETLSESITGFENELQSNLEWLDERVSAWKKECSTCQDWLNQAKKSLERCIRHSQDEDERRCCEQEEMEVRKAERALKEACYNLEIAQRAKSLLQKESDTFRGHAQKYLVEAGKAVDEGKKFLSQKERILSGYSSSGPVASSSLPIQGIKEIKVSSGEKGSEFEQWANEKVFHGKGKRLVIDPAINTHLDKFGDGVGITKEKRITDAFLGRRGEIWDLKSGYENGGIDLDQRDEYAMMERAGHVWVEGEGKRCLKKKVQSINYLFDSEAGARANASMLRGIANIWFVDKDKNVQIFTE